MAPKSCKTFAKLQLTYQQRQRQVRHMTWMWHKLMHYIRILLKHPVSYIERHFCTFRIKSWEKDPARTISILTCYRKLLKSLKYFIFGRSLFLCSSWNHHFLKGISLHRSEVSQFCQMAKGIKCTRFSVQFSKLISTHFTQYWVLKRRLCLHSKMNKFRMTEI